MSGTARRVLIIGSWTFFMSVLLNYGSISALESLSLWPSMLILVFIILVGVLFDIVGTSAAAGREAPFAAMSSRRVPGSRQALRLVRRADSVASFCNDVVGDICGTLSGAVGATIVMSLAVSGAPASFRVVKTLILALVAAVTVAGKAWGKGMAIRNYVPVLMLVGRLLGFFEERLGLPGILSSEHRRKKHQPKGNHRFARRPTRGVE